MQVEYVSPILIENISVFSELLNREILIDIYLPRKVTDLSQVSLLLINDGQDMEKMHFQSILDHLYTEEAIEP
ncbi:MAG: esterase, partial [Chitinophagaceae bacterium]